MLEKRLRDRIQNKKAQLDALRPLPQAAAHALDEQLAIEWIYNTNALEGSSLTQRETELILQTGIAIGGKPLREHFEVLNQQAALQLARSMAGGPMPLTARDVRELHALLLARIDDEHAGKYRTVPQHIAGAAYAAAAARHIPARMDAWAAWLFAQEGVLDAVEAAALAHQKLVAIRPFVSGNGRTARLIMNLVLLRAGYPPAIIARANRRQYFGALAGAAKDNAAPLVNLVGRAVERSLTLFLAAASPQAAQPEPEDAWIPLREAAEGTPYSQEYLSLLARLGRLEAVKFGRNWYTSRRAVEAYLATVQVDSQLR